MENKIVYFIIMKLIYLVILAIESIGDSFSRRSNFQVLPAQLWGGILSLSVVLVRFPNKTPVQGPTAVGG